MAKTISNFIKHLSRFKPGPNVFNQYSGRTLNNRIRKENLKIYLEKMLMVKPKYLIIGEAVGYQGGRLTGVPLSSEDLIVNQLDGFGIYTDEYQKTKETGKPVKEPTATIVWELNRELNFLPLHWNSFPFHPHKPGNAFSNRTPTMQEIISTQQFILDLIDIYQIKKIIAMGNKAESSLIKIGLDYFKVRHPAHGGKNKYRQGIMNLLSQFFI